FAREALPGTRTTPETLDAATPFLRQVRLLVSKPELRGLSQDLRQTIPKLTKLNHRTVPFLNASRSLSSCFDQVIIPWSNSSVPDTHFPPQTVRLNKASSSWATAYTKAQRLSTAGHQAQADAIVAKATKQWVQSKAKVDPKLQAQLNAARKQGGSK